MNVTFLLCVSTANCNRPPPLLGIRTSVMPNVASVL